MSVGRGRKKGSRRRKIRISGQLRDFDELRTLKSSELKIGQADEKDYKNLRWRYKKDGDVEFVEDDDNLADDDIVFGGSKSDIRRIEDMERNISVLATKLMTTDGGATDDDDDNFGTVVNKKTRFKDDVRFSEDVTIDDNLTVGGDLTVNGTTTTINTTTLTVSDNIIVLNKDVTGTPSENSGIEVRRGTSTNAKLLWNETQDHWEIASGGTTGRILTVSDEGTGNGLDADTLDGQEGSYYLDYNNFTNTPSISSDADTLDGQEGSYYLDYNNFTNTPSGSSGSGIFTASNNDLKQTHDGTQVEFDLDAVSDVSQSTGVTNVSGQTLTLSGDDFSADSRGIFYISGTNHGTKEDVVITTNGTGTGTTGFANPDGATSLFGFRGFTATSGVRTLTTANIDTSNYLTLEFYIIQGNGSNGGEATDANDNMALHYSTNGGNTYATLATYLGSPRNYQTWTKIMVTLPSAAKASSVKFRWYNTHTASGDYDHWGVSLVRLHDGSSEVDPSFVVNNNGTEMINANKSGVTIASLIVANVTTTERDALTAANGMIIYNTTDNKFQGYENGAWANLI